VLAISVRTLSVSDTEAISSNYVIEFQLPSGFHNMFGVSWPANYLSASPALLSAHLLVLYIYIYIYIYIYKWKSRRILSQWHFNKLSDSQAVVKTLLFFGREFESFPEHVYCFVNRGAPDTDALSLPETLNTTNAVHWVRPLTQIITGFQLQCEGFSRAPCGCSCSQPVLLPHSDRWSWGCSYCCSFLLAIWLP